MNNHFPVVGVLDHAVQPQRGTVTISRTARTFSVRPYRRQRVYTLPLATVAELVCHWIIRAELREKQAAKAQRKKWRKR